MKKSLFLLPIFIFYAISTFAQRPPCKAHDILKEAIQTNPEFAKERLLLEEQTQQFIASGRVVDGTITIPVVFHVVHNGDPIGSGENIAATYLHAQLQQLNDDFRRLNSDKGNTPSDFTSVASDVEIEFCLATVDPNGNATTGIVRHQMTRTSWSEAPIESSLKPTTIWNRDHYLNFYIVRFGGADSQTLGYAQFPGGPANTDAVVCGYQFVGSLAVPNPAGGAYGYGRTATHEVGHWLNLYHIWGDGNCNVDDEVADTPNQNGENTTGSPCSYPGRNSCTSGPNDLPDMFQNYMDYSDDECMNLFTVGQRTRMRALFDDAGGARFSLINSMGCGGDGGGGGSDCATCCDEDITTNETYTTNTDIKTSKTITSTDIINSPRIINYTAGESITLNPSFEANLGSTFSATITDCSSLIEEGPNQPVTNLIDSNDPSTKFIGSPVSTHIAIQARPNPFNKATTLSYQLPTASNLHLEVFDVMGRSVQVITKNEYWQAGKYEWTLHSDQLDRGTYFVILQTPTEQVTTKIVLIK